MATNAGIPGRPEGGVTAESPTRVRLPMFVAPTTTSFHNTFRPELNPVACCRLDDVRFGFESSFVRMSATNELARLGELLNSKPGVVLSIFGHADPVGSDDFNKLLSGRRAMAVYGLLVRDVALWEKLYSSPLGGDDWGLPAIRSMLEALQIAPGSLDLVPDISTTEALAAFQTQSDLPPTGNADSATRAKLFAVYMDCLCRDPQGAPFTVDKAQFLGRGADAGGKADYQGCGEFNPVMLFSHAEATAFAASADKTERNRQNGPNRRVVIYLFAAGARVEASAWPCPRAEEGLNDCKKRLWSDWGERRKLTESRREAQRDHNTFLCRFYDRLVHASPCEDVPLPKVSELVAGRLRSRFSVGKTFPKPSSIPMLRQVVEHVAQHPSLRVLVVGHTDRTGADAMNLELSRNRAAAVRAFLVGDANYFRQRFRQADPVAAWDWEEVQWMLSALEIDGDPFYAGFVDGHCSDMTLTAIQSFQLASGMEASHECDNATLTALIQGYLDLLGPIRPKPSQIEIVGGGSWHPPRTFGSESTLSTELLDETDLLPGFRRVEIFLGEDPLLPPTKTCPPTRHARCTPYEIWCRNVTKELDASSTVTMNVRIVDVVGRVFGHLPVSLYGYPDDADGEVLLASLTTSRYGTLRLTAPPGPYALSFVADGHPQRTAFQIHPDEAGGVTVRVYPEHLDTDSFESSEQ
ncbi:MAG: OmpA family protein [Polyangiaceae bacterium]|nr:OmpA family protein [Polyangiaceae bacterium]